MSTVLRSGQQRSKSTLLSDLHPQIDYAMRPKNNTLGSERRTKEQPTLVNEPAINPSPLERIVRDLVIEGPFRGLDYFESMVFFCKTIAAALSAARVGIWEVSPDRNRLELVAMWKAASGEVESGIKLSRNDARSYLDAVAQDFVLEIPDAKSDPRCKELARNYLPKNGIGAMLDCPIRTFGGLAGVVCIEHVGGHRDWTRSEVNFALAITGLVSLTFEHNRRTLAEQSASENLDRLKIYTELATDWYWQTDADFRFTMLEGLPALDGQKPEDYVGKLLWEVPVLQPVDSLWETLKGRVSERKRIYDFVVCATAPTGDHYYAEIAGVPRMDAKGTYLGYWGTAKDVSVRERQRRALADVHSEKEALLEQLQLVFESCGIGAFRYSGATESLEFDDSFRKLYGIDASKELGPRNFSSQLVHPDDKDGMDKFIREAITGQKHFDSHIFRAKRAGGDIRHMRSFWKLSGTEEKGDRNIVGLHIDVTDVIDAQQERAKVLQHIAAIAENVPGVLAEVSWADGKLQDLLFVSTKCLELWGFGRDEVISDPSIILSLQSSEQVSHGIAIVEEAVSSGKQCMLRAPMICRSGERIWIDFRVQAIEQSDGTHRVYCLFTDVTKEVMAVQEARHQAELAFQSQKNESIGQLTGGVAHDFNNILAVALGSFELLLDSVQSPDQTEIIENGIEACERGAGLTRSLLAFARKSRLEPVLIDLNDVARQAQNWMRRALPESVVVETALLAGLWPVKLDLSSIESALLNLILNARDAMNGVGKLTIETANVRIEQAYIDHRDEPLEPGRYVMLAVSDTGSGIEPAVLKRIFEPFFSTKPPGQGSGVGLSMVMGFVRQSEGTVQVYSELEHGTTFKLYFPAVGRAAFDEPQKQPSVSSMQTPRARIMLVEDEDRVRAVLEGLLRNAGFDVVAKTSGDSAFASLQEDSEFDLIITDIVMPGKLQGTHLASEIRKANPDFKFIFLSGYAAESMVHGNGLQPEDIRLMKPVRKQELLNAIEKALGS